jgi:hypothetical protein
MSKLFHPSTPNRVSLFATSKWRAFKQMYKNILTGTTNKEHVSYPWRQQEKRDSDVLHQIIGYNNGENLFS